MRTLTLASMSICERSTATSCMYPTSRAQQSLASLAMCLCAASGKHGGTQQVHGIGW